MSESFVDIVNVSKVYGMGDAQIFAASDVNLNIEKGEFCVILGPSGAGKTTILNLLGGMDKATGGDIIVDGQNIAKYSEKQLTGYRRNDVGFVFQFYNLMPNLTAIENVEIASEICKDHDDAAAALEKVGVLDRRNNFPAQLSGGEQQRVSIARALAKRPKLLLCDEPTGALDYQTGKNVLNVLYDTCRSENMTTVVITHNAVISKMADRIIRVKNGVVERIDLNDNPVRADELEW